MGNDKKIVQDMLTSKESGMVKSSVFGSKSDSSGFFARRRQTTTNEPAGDFLSKVNPSSKVPKIKFLKIILAVALVVFIGAVYVIGNTFFTKATVTVDQKNQTVAVDTTVISKKEPTEPGDLVFKVVSIEEHTQKEIPAAGSKFIERKASGQIIIYNNFSTEVQRFVKNTRFQTTDGKVFRINNAVSVPGLKVVAGKNTPGSVEATVFADQPGAEYNIPLSDFTLPGLKDSDPERYKGFYARSKTPMTGGISGEMVTPAPDELEKARVVMEKELTDKLTAEIASKIPQGYVLFKSLTTATFSLEQDDSNTVEKGKAAKVYIAKEKGVLTGILYDLNALSSYLAKRTLPGYSGDSVALDKDKLAQLVVIPTTPLSDAVPDKEFSFHVKGNAYFVWNIDRTALRNDLKGIPISEESQEAVFKKYPSIIKAEVDIRPFWRQSFPSDPEKITIQASTTATRAGDE